MPCVASTGDLFMCEATGVQHGEMSHNDCNAAKPRGDLTRKVPCSLCQAKTLNGKLGE